MRGFEQGSDTFQEVFCKIDHEAHLQGALEWRME